MTPLSLVRYAPLLLLVGASTFAWRTQRGSMYPTLGSTLPYGLVLGAVLAVAGLALFGLSLFLVPSRSNGARRIIGVIGNCVAIAAVALAAGTGWAPWINTHLDSGPATTATGTVEEIGTRKGPSKGPKKSRRVTVNVDGVDLWTNFSPYKYFWGVPNVRDGGPVEVTLRPGFFGVPWIEKMSDAG